MYLIHLGKKKKKKQIKAVVKCHFFAFQTSNIQNFHNPSSGRKKALFHTVAGETVTGTDSVGAHWQYLENLKICLPLGSISSLSRKLSYRHTPICRQRRTCSLWQLTHLSALCQRLIAGIKWHNTWKGCESLAYSKCSVNAYCYYYNIVRSSKTLETT